jgi:hypothetical protein
MEPQEKSHPNNYPAFTSIFLGAILLCGDALTAQEPLLVNSSPFQETSISADVSRIADDRQPCVLLRNDNVLLGVARQVGQYVLIKTSEGSEVKLDQSQVLCWADSLPNLYRYRVDHRQVGDLSLMLQDVRWCLRHDLYDLAASELLTIRRIDPGNLEAQRLLDQLKRRWSQANEPGLSADDHIQSRSTFDLKNISTEETEVDSNRHPDSLPSQLVEQGIEPEMPAALLRGFASHIQPMLINRCGMCHSDTVSTDRQWSMRLPSSGTRASAKLTRQNLSSVLPYLGDAKSSLNVLLLKATVAHGGAPAALTIRNDAAIQSLSNWSAMAVETIEHRQSNSSPKIDTVQGQRVRPLNAQRPEGISENQDFLADQSKEQLVGWPERSGIENSGPSRLPLVSNPFDPGLFNRRFDLRKQIDQ